MAVSHVCDCRSIICHKLDACQGLRELSVSKDCLLVSINDHARFASQFRYGLPDGLQDMKLIAPECLLSFQGFRRVRGSTLDRDDYTGWKGSALEGVG